MKVLVTGCNGLLGQKILQTLSRELYQVFGVDLQAECFLPGLAEYRKLDITDRREVAAYFRSVVPDIVIHAAAFTNVDRCELEKELCWRVNVIGTDNLVGAATKAGSRFIFVSTDYVFDGERGPYNEEAVPNPVNYYGRSKLAAENIVRASGLPHTIVRTIVLYGTGVNIKSSFLTWLLEMLRAGRSVRIVTDQWGNTTITDDLAAALDRILLFSLTGVYHVGGRGYMSRYEFAVRAANFFGLESSLIEPITTAELRQPARRPMRSGLEVDKAERDMFLSFRTVEESFELYRKQESGKAVGGGGVV